MNMSCNSAYKKGGAKKYNRKYRNIEMNESKKEENCNEKNIFIINGCMSDIFFK